MATEELDIKDLLEKLEASYIIFDKMFDFDPKEFLDDADTIFKAKDIEDIDVPMNLKDLLELLEIE